MILWIIFILLVAGLFLWHTRSSYFGIDFTDVLISGFMGVLLGSMLFFGISGVIYSTAETKYDLIETKDILSLKDNNSLSGNFFLGSGNIGGKVKYVYLIEDSMGINMKTVNHEQAYINEGFDDPKVETYHPSYSVDILNYLFANYADNKYKFFIPQGSIKYQYNIDLQ